MHLPSCCFVSLNKSMQIRRSDSTAITERSVQLSDYTLPKEHNKHALQPARWAAPETHRGHFTIKSDVWSFGVTCWEIFNACQVLPFKSLYDIQKVITAVQNGESSRYLTHPQDCPIQAYKIIQQCWRMEPSSRPSFDTLHRSLSSIAHSLP